MKMKTKGVGRKSPNEFVMGFFGHKPISVKVTHNPDSIRSKFVSTWAIPPERTLGWSTIRKGEKTGYRKALIFVNKKLPEYVKARGNLRKAFETEYTLVHELAHVYAEREGKVTEYMHEHLANLISLEYFAKTNPNKLKLILRAAGNEKTANRFLIPKELINIYKYIRTEEREQLISDVLLGKIKFPGKELDKYLLGIVKKMPSPPKDYITYLENAINIPF